MDDGSSDLDAYCTHNMYRRNARASRQISTHLASLSFALPSPYAIAGAGVISADEAPAIAAVAVATLSRNPLRVAVPTSSFRDRERADREPAARAGEGAKAKAEAGERTARAAHAADRREEAPMVEIEGGGRSEMRRSFTNF